MSNANVPQIDRLFVVTPTANGLTGEFGTGSNSGGTMGAVTLAVIPSGDFSGSFVVVGRPFGQPAQGGAPFVPIPYRRVSLNNVASDYAMVADQITTTALIQIPSNGMSVGVLMSCSAGKCSLIPTRLAGASSV